MKRCKLLVGQSKDEVPELLNASIVVLVSQALSRRSVFTVALSGGSLPSFLSTLGKAFETAQVDPQWNKWHVILADERCVLVEDADSNLGALQAELLSKISIPRSQVYGINQSKLAESTEAVATDYELIVRRVLELSGGMLDLAVVGFGPDGHTCSLFPNHPLLQEQSKLVAAITDSPKPPPHRITLTFRVLNHLTRHVIFCGAGDSKAPILKGIFAGVQQVATTSGSYYATLNSPAPYPCGMVDPQDTLSWVVDRPAMEGIPIARVSAMAQVFVAPTKNGIPTLLTSQIVATSVQAIASRGAFTIALSGGSLPSFLASLGNAFEQGGLDPSWDKWHVLLADERCVVSTDPDSNMGALRNEFLNNVPIPPSQIYGIDESKLSSTAMVAESYESVLRKVLQRSGGNLDLAVLGFGPDGHTCSLFPQHPLLEERSLWVAPIIDSPKPPSNRITLTFPFLTERTRHVLFCGAGDSKAPILRAIFQNVTQHGSTSPLWTAQMANPSPYPCGMVIPMAMQSSSRLIWIVDQDAMAGIVKSKRSPLAEIMVAPSKANIPSLLHNSIISVCQDAMMKRGIFTIALSGGSLPNFLSTLPQSFDEAGVLPHWEDWHVLLADERCVLSTDPESNLGALTKELLDTIPIPKNQIYGIKEGLLHGKEGDDGSATNAIAMAYEGIVRTVLYRSGGYLDLAVLGFGPDGHTCSLFPNHGLLKERTRWVAPIIDSPKPPSHRITLTFPVLNEHTRFVIFCGAGESKRSILHGVWDQVIQVGGGGGSNCSHYLCTMSDPAPFPCGMVIPMAVDSCTTGEVDYETTAPRHSLMWVVDEAAMPLYRFST